MKAETKQMCKSITKDVQGFLAHFFNAKPQKRGIKFWRAFLHQTNHAKI
jgi:hypothetical protein